MVSDSTENRNKKLSTYCVKAVLFYLLPKHVHVFLRSEISKACRFKFFRHRRFLGATISIVKLKRHLINKFTFVMLARYRVIVKLMRLYI